MLLVSPAAAAAQDFGVMESAETINQGNYKLQAHPLFLFGDGDDEAGVVFGLGYGFTPNFDLEAKVGLFDGVNFFGADAELWLAQNQPLDVSVHGGFHIGASDFTDSTGIDLGFIASAPLTPRLELYGALDLAFNSFDVDNELIDDDYTTFHLVPGIEYAVSDDLDFLAEIGIGLNDDSSNYFTAGVAYYLR
jgi:hypothetical protein